MADNNFVTGRYTICKIDGTDYVSLTDLGLEGMAESVSGRTKGNLKGQVTCKTNVNWNFNGSMTIVGENEEETYKLRDKIMGLVGEIVEFEYFTCIDPSAETIAPVNGTAIYKGTCFIASYSESSQMDDNLTCTFSANIQSERLAESNLIKLDVTAGLFDFSYNVDALDKWVFADGSVSTELRPTRTLTEAQTVKLYVTDYNGELYINETAGFVGDVEQFRNMTNLINVHNSDATGDIAYLSNLTYYAAFGDTNVTGDISALTDLVFFADFHGTNVYGDIINLSNLVFYANFRGTEVTGDIAALSNLTNTADFWSTDVTGNIASLSNLTYSADFENTNVSGDIASLHNLTYYAGFGNTNVTGNIEALSGLTYSANFYNTDVSGDLGFLSGISDTILLDNTNVSGHLSPPDSLVRVHLNGTNMSSEDTLQTLRNMDANFTTAKQRSIYLVNNIDLSSDEVVALMNSLYAKGCTVTFIETN